MAHIEVEREDRIATIILNRPEKLNAITGEMHERLIQTFRRIAETPGIHVVVLRGNGPSFCTGHDLDELAQRSRRFETDVIEHHQHGLNDLGGWFTLLGNMPQPVIAQVQGHCINFGLELAMNCDLVIAAEDAQFASRPLRGTRAYYHLWPWLIGYRHMKEIAFTKRPISGREAVEMGMINRAVSLEALAGAVQELAAEVAKLELDALAIEKQAIQRCWEAMGMVSGLKASADLAALSHMSKSARRALGR